MKKTIIFLSSLFLFLGLMTTGFKASSCYSIAGKNIGTCYQSPTTGQEKCVTPQAGDVVDCVPGVIIIIGD